MRELQGTGEGMAEANYPIDKVRALQRALYVAAKQQRQSAMATLRQRQREHPYVRAEAVAALATQGDVQPAIDALVDRSPLVRFQAQTAARRAGHEPVANYRRLSGDGYPAPAVIAGIGETGGPSDIPDLLRWLGHPTGRGRAEAVRGLRRLNAATVERVGGLLTDPSAAVTRQVVKAVEKDARKLDSGALAELIGKDRPRHVRVAAIRLLHQHGPWTRLATDLRLVDDLDPSLRTRARGDLDS
jgi:hypothetical protein